MWDEAQAVLVGGVDSPVRAFRHTDRDPLMLVKGRGATVVDANGRAWTDFIMGWGALVLGHQPPAVIRALRATAAHSTLLGLTHPAEVALASLIARCVPSVEQVRFTVSGTEACMIAVRLARAHTGRTKLLVFDGGYHGHGDTLMAGRPAAPLIRPTGRHGAAQAGQTAGLPHTLIQSTIVVPWNDPHAFDQAMTQHGEQLACVILEPVAANMGVIPPEAGYLQQIRQATASRGVLLIFDEVVTGFRLGLGGAQGLFGIRPDLTTFGKIIGGGLPIGAVGGPTRLMQRLAPEGDVYHAGTFAGHPLSMACGAAVLHELIAQPPYASLEAKARRVEQALQQAAERARVPVQINRVGSMLTVFFTEQPVRQLAQAQASQRSRFARWAHALRQRGILIPPSPFEACFLSTAHTARHLDRFERAAMAAFLAVAEH